MTDDAKYWAQFKDNPGEHEVPREIYQRQVELYTQGLFEQYRDIHPMPVGSDTLIADAALASGFPVAQGYAESDVAFTMQWWDRFKGRGEPVMTVKSPVTGIRSVIFDYNDLVRPETLEAMTRPVWGSP